MSGWQLLKSFQAICVIDACHPRGELKDITKTIIETIFEKIKELNPNELSIIDCYQLYLCLNYVDKKEFSITDPVRKQFRTRFSDLIGWLRHQQTTVSASQQRLTNFLRLYRSDVVSEKYINGLYVDIWLKNVNVVIEFDGPFHFMSAVPEEDLPMLRVTRDFFHEVIVGAKVLRINYVEYDSLNHNDPEQVKDYLQKKLANAGITLLEPTPQVEPDSLRIGKEAPYF